jgi:hypothetical protein
MYHSMLVWPLQLSHHAWFGWAPYTPQRHNTNFPTCPQAAHTSLSQILPARLYLKQLRLWFAFIWPFHASSLPMVPHFETKETYSGTPRHL